MYKSTVDLMGYSELFTALSLFVLRYSQTITTMTIVSMNICPMCALCAMRHEETPPLLFL